MINNLEKMHLILEEHTYKPMTGHENAVDRETRGKKAKDRKIKKTMKYM